MSADGLFHIDGDDDLVAMTVTPYLAEDVLQRLLESHADLLAGGQMTPHAARRWLLIQREQSVPDSDGSSGRWSIDHLFVDQDAVPTLVEVKRSSDTRIRREVVGQMLDYAANGVRYWPLDRLQGAFEATQRDRGDDPQDALWELCQNRSVSVDEFFERVGDNLRSGRIRMVFVADVIPDELQRITEFLNEQMNPAEVFAVEVKQYRAIGYPGSVIVPTVYGRTAAAIAKTPTRAAPDRSAALAESSPSTHEVLKRITDMAAQMGFQLRETPGGLLLKTAGGESIANVWIGKYNSVDVPLEQLRDRGQTAEADNLLIRLQAMTSKRLTHKNPALPSSDAVHNWPALADIFNQIAGLYA